MKRMFESMAAALRRAGWSARRALMSAGACAALFISPSALAQDDRPSPPDFATAWYALMNDNREYRNCVADARRQAMTRMWEIRAPFESALTEINVAYRTCDGFDAFWATLYFQGFDDPETFIAIEIGLMRAAARRLLETFDAEDDDRRRRHALEDAAAFLSDVQDRAEAATLSDRQRRHVEDRLIAMRYALEALGEELRLDDLAVEGRMSLVEHHPDLLTAALPETALEEATAALSIARRNRGRQLITQLADEIRR